MAPQRRVTHSELTYQHRLTADTISHPSAWSSSLEEPLSPRWEQDTNSQGVTLNSGRSKDHKSGQQEQTLISRSSALASAKEFQPVKRWEQSRTERRCWCRHFPHTGTWQSSTLSCSLQMPGHGHPSWSWRKLKFVTCHEDAGDDEIVGTTLQHFQPSQSPSPGKAGRGRLLNPRTDRMWGMGNQHQSTGPAGSKMGLYRFMDWRLKTKITGTKQRDTFYCPLPVTGDSGHNWNGW